MYFCFRQRAMADKDKDNEEVELTIADEAVVTKYKTAGEIANRKCSCYPFFIGYLASRNRCSPQRTVGPSFGQWQTIAASTVVSFIFDWPFVVLYNPVRHNLKTCTFKWNFLLYQQCFSRYFTSYIDYVVSSLKCSLDWNLFIAVQFQK